MESTAPADAGRPTVLAGRALADIGASGVNPTTRRDVMRELRQTMQDRDLETDRLNDPPRSRAHALRAGEAWDELGGLPDDLDAWVLCSKCADDGAILLAAEVSRDQSPVRAFHPGWRVRKPAFWGGEEA